MFALAGDTIKSCADMLCRYDVGLISFYST